LRSSPSKAPSMDRRAPRLRHVKHDAVAAPGTVDSHDMNMDAALEIDPLALSVSICHRPILLSARAQRLHGEHVKIGAMRSACVMRHGLSIGLSGDPRAGYRFKQSNRAASELGMTYRPNCGRPASSPGAHDRQVSSMLTSHRHQAGGRAYFKMRRPFVFRISRPHDTFSWCRPRAVQIGLAERSAHKLPDRHRLQRNPLPYNR